MPATPTIVPGFVWYVYVTVHGVADYYDLLPPELVCCHHLLLLASSDLVFHGCYLHYIHLFSYNKLSLNFVGLNEIYF